MKKHLVLIIVMAGMALQCAAQIYVPKFQRIVKVTSKGVNLREAPSTTSKKLLWSSKHNVANFEHPNLPVGYVPARADYLLVIDETTDWIHAYALLDCRRIANTAVYVSKKACKTRNVNDLTDDYIKRYAWGGIKQSGAYAGWATILVNRPYFRFAGVVANGVGFGLEVPGNDGGSFLDEYIPDKHIKEALQETSYYTTICIADADNDEEDSLFVTYNLDRLGFKGDYDRYK